MGNPVNVISDHWSCTSNPAGTGALNSAAFGLFYRNYYNIKELNSGGFSFCIPTKSGNFGFGFVSSRSGVLTENKATMSYGRRIGEKFRAGIGLHWMMFNQPSDYRDLYAWIPSLGVQWIPCEKLIAGFSISNPVEQEYRPSGYRNIPSSVSAGIGFKPAEEFFMLFEFEKIRGGKARYILGFEVKAGKSFFMRFGINRRDFTGYSAGAGYIHGKTSIDVAVDHHPALGFIPSAGVSFAF